MNASAKVLAARLEKFEDIAPALEELRRSARGFDETMTAVAGGRSITNAEGQTVRLSTASAEGDAAMAQIVTLWTDYKTRLDPVLRWSGTPYEQNAEGQKVLNRRGETFTNQVNALVEKSATVQEPLTKFAAQVSADIG